MAGVTTNISSNITNNFHYSFLRNWWSWSRTGDTLQFARTGWGAGAGAASRETKALAPYNVNTQQTRTRFWDGQDQMFRDDVNILNGNHLFQFGGTYQHNFNWHQRTDNGGGINYQPVYQLGQRQGAGISVADASAVCDRQRLSTDWGRDYAAALGIVSIAQQAYTRTGPNLGLESAADPGI